MKTKNSKLYTAPEVELSTYVLEAGFADTAPAIEDVKYGDEFVW